MYPERTRTCTSIAELKIPHGTIAALAGVSASKVSEYVKQLDVSGQSTSKIERAVSDVADLIATMQTYFGLRPDLKDVASLREAVTGLKTAKNLHAAQMQLAQSEREVAAALKEFATR